MPWVSPLADESRCDGIVGACCAIGPDDGPQGVIDGEVEGVFLLFFLFALGTRQCLGVGGRHGGVFVALGDDVLGEKFLAGLLRRGFGCLVGQCMKAMRGQGNPKIINELLAKKLG